MKYIDKAYGAEIEFSLLETYKQINLSQNKNMILAFEFVNDILHQLLKTIFFKVSNYV